MGKLIIDHHPILGNVLVQLRVSPRSLKSCRNPSKSVEILEILSWFFGILRNVIVILRDLHNIIVTLRKPFEKPLYQTFTPNKVEEHRVKSNVLRVIGEETHNLRVRTIQKKPLCVISKEG